MTYCNTQIVTSSTIFPLFCLKHRMIFISNDLFRMVHCILIFNWNERNVTTWIDNEFSMLITNLFAKCFSRIALQKSGRNILQQWSDLFVSLYLMYNFFYKMLLSIRSGKWHSRKLTTLLIKFWKWKCRLICWKKKRAETTWKCTTTTK